MKDKIILCIVALLFFTSVAIGVKYVAVPKIAQTGQNTTLSSETTNPVVTKGDEIADTATATNESISTNESTTATTKSQVATQAPLQQPAVQTTKAVATTAKPTTAAAKTTAKASTSTGQYTGFEQEMLKRVNAERAKHGVAPLTLDSTLVEMSRIRAEELSRYYNSNHKRPDGREWYTILDTLKGTGLEKWHDAGENIAYGQSPSEIMDDWIASPGHYQNMLKSAYTHVGFGCYNKNGVMYWEQMFIGV